MPSDGSDRGFILCVGLTLQELTETVQLLRDRAMVLAATDLGAARDLLCAVGASHPSGRYSGAGAAGDEPGDDAPAGALLAADPRLPVGLQVSPPTRVRIRAGRLVIDPHAREVTVDGHAIRLSPREFDLLTVLASDASRVWTFAELSKQVWGSDFRGDKEHLVSTVKRLRRRLATSEACQVHSVHGIGFRLRVAPA